MISRTIVVKTINDLKGFVNRSENNILFKKASSVLIQIFTAESDPKWSMKIVAVLEQKIPGAVIVGASSMGEIARGQLCIDSTVLSFAFFDQTELQGFIVDVSSGSLVDLGKNLSQRMGNINKKIAGVLLLATVSNINIAEFLIGFSNPTGNYPVFGGGAGNYNTTEEPLVFLNHEYSTKGVIAVAILGDQISIEAHTYLGWQALTKEMVITETDGLWVKKIDGLPAVNVYQHYLNIQSDDDFFINVLEFPFLVKRDGIEYAKSPKKANDEGAVQFFTYLKEGESFRIGYGNPSTIIEQSQLIKHRIDDFNPQSIFLYSCVGRRYLLQNEVDLETEPFEAIAPTFGFYTFGEFYGQANHVHMFNSTMVAVSMKEGEYPKNRRNDDKKAVTVMRSDPFATKHSQSISRLINFIKVVTEELEEATREARMLAERDYLTKAFNRMKAHEFMENEISRCQRYGSEFSILMLDVDLFKTVNDTFGHNVGDDILIHLVKLLELEIRKIDVLSRWGGEEFLIVMPETGIEGARVTAERIRAVVELTIFPRGIHQTCSFGVTSFKEGETIEEIIDRGDKALYKAKQQGRNCVVTM